MSYLVQEADYFVNYIFRKDLTFFRMRNTTKVIDTICYTKQQLSIVMKLHPDSVPLNYKVSTREAKEFFQVSINRSSEQFNKIINYLKQ
jgi:hypothetical protein